MKPSRAGRGGGGGGEGGREGRTDGRREGGRETIGVKKYIFHLRWVYVLFLFINMTKINI